MTEPVKQSALPIESTVLNGRFWLLRAGEHEVLGQGGFGITYLARDESLGRLVAIKECYPTDFATREGGSRVVPYTSRVKDFEWAKTSFIREAQMLARFQHPAIVRVVDIFEDNGTAYMVMEYEQGRTLDKWMEEPGNLASEAAVRRMLESLLGALRVVHAAKVWHRDIKPENIMVRPDGSVVLIDFGSARQAVESKSRPLSAIVSDGYSPPEQYLQTGQQGPYTDLYALAAVMYHWVTGAKPVTATDRMYALTKSQPDPFVPLSQSQSGRYSAQLLGALDAALQSDERARPQSVEAFEELLEGKANPATSTTPTAPAPVEEKTRVLRRSVPSAKTPPREEATLVLPREPEAAAPVSRPPSVTPEQPSPSQQPPESASTKRSSRGPLIVLLGLLAAIAALIYFETRSANGPSEESYVQASAPTAAPAEDAVDRSPKAEASPSGAVSTSAPIIIADLKLKMVPIAPGSFTLGSTSPEAYEDEKKLTQVTLTKPYWLGETEVTQGQWEAVMGNNPSNFKGADFPVEEVSYDDALAFCAKLNERERAAGRLPEGYAYTLPTEAQWEYACRAGTTGDYPGDLDAMAWYDKNSGNTTHAVGTKQANAWGLYDMQGNVWEWCLDWYGAYPGGSVTDYAGPTSGTDRVFRGGSWLGSALDCRSSSRNDFSPDYRINNLGFRLALSSIR